MKNLCFKIFPFFGNFEFLPNSKSDISSSEKIFKWNHKYYEQNFMNILKKLTNSEPLKNAQNLTF